MNPPIEAKQINKYLVEPVQKRLGYYKVGRFMYEYGRYSKRVPSLPIESLSRDRQTIINGMIYYTWIW